MKEDLVLMLLSMELMKDFQTKQQLHQPLQFQLFAVEHLLELSR